MTPRAIRSYPAHHTNDGAAFSVGPSAKRLVFKTNSVGVALDKAVRIHNHFNRIPIAAALSMLEDVVGAATIICDGNDT